MRARILTVGDELLVGQVLNTNAAWLGELLTSLGLDVERVDTVGDDPDAVRRAVADALPATGILVVTGGLGPTHDDVTKTAVAAVFDVGTRFDPGTFERVRARFERRGVAMPEANRGQAEIPEGFEALENPVGTAPGLWRDPDGRNGILVVLPGVPHEMQTLMRTAVVPRLARMEGRRAIVQRTLLTTGIGESSLQERLHGVSELLSRSRSLAYLPGLHGVRLRVTARAGDPVGAGGAASELVDWIRARVGGFVYGEGEDTLEAVVGRALAGAGATVAVAESCTGGLVSHRLTNVPGSSGWVVGGIVAYSNRVKEEALGVPAGTLVTHGAVSREAALAMAHGVRARLRADYGLATTGIMGPTGGTPGKPVGTVWTAVACPDEREDAVLLRLGTDRLRNKERASTGALDLLRRALAARDSAGESGTG